MMRGRSLAWVVVVLPIALAVPGCDRTKPADRPKSEEGPAVTAMTVRRLGPSGTDPASVETPIEFALQDAPGHLRVTLELDGTGDAPAPFVHDALFLLKGDGRLRLSFRPPWPDHPNGQVAIRVEGQGTESTLVYEPQLWFDRPGASVAVTVQVPENGGSPVAAGAEVRLAQVVATVPGAFRPMTATFTLAAGPEPIKPRVKAGVRAPR